MSQFSSPLKEKLKNYFDRTQGLVLSDSQAEEFLDSLANLFLLFSEIKDEERPRIPPAGGRRGRSST